MRALSVLALVVVSTLPAAAQPRLFGREFPAARAAAPTLPEGYFLVDVAGGATFDLPVAAVGAPSGDLYVAEKAGVVRVVRDGALQAEPFLDLRDEVHGGLDYGLLGLALAPDFGTSGHVFLSYVVAEGGRETNADGSPRTDAFSRVVRYTAAPGGLTALPASRRVLLGATWAEGLPACSGSHSIGTLHLGPDGALYVGAGDGAGFEGADEGGEHPACFEAGRLPASEDIGAFRAQRPESLAGKILRIDPETGLGLPDNPFWTGDGADNASRVWALGVRNPFRFALGAGAPATAFAGDVGYLTWEEMNVATAGANLGWPCYEGPGPLAGYWDAAPPTNGCPTVAMPQAPVFWWHHGDPAHSVPAGRTGASVIGGPVYAGTRYPEAMHGRLVYADYERGWIATAAVGPDGALSDDAPFATDVGYVVHIGYDPATQWLTLTDVAFGTVQQLRHVDGEDNSAPVVQLGASPHQGTAPLEVTFSGSASFDPDGDGVTYAWAFGDGAASALPDPAHRYTAPGLYTARLTVTDGAGASASATTEIRVSAGSAPTAEIASPAEGAFLAAGDLAGGGATLSLVGVGADADQAPETLAYAWEVDLLHNAHVHPDAFAASGPAASYAVEAHGAGGDYYAVRIRLTVTDAEGLQATDERVVPFEYADGALPPGWTAETLGTPVVEGASFLTDTGAFSVRGSGDLWGLDDAAEVATRALAGDGSVTARVASVTGGAADGGAKAGVLLRPDLDPRGPYAMMYRSPTQGVGFQWRAGAGQETQATTLPPEGSAPVWLRLERSGAQVRGFASPDGASWTLVGEATLPLGAVHAGLAVTATDVDLAGLVATALFTDVGVTGASLPTPAPAPREPFAVASVVPNPARGPVTVGLRGAPGGALRAEVLDLLGRRVAEADGAPSDAAERTLPLDLSRLPPGLYVVRVEAPSGEGAVGRVTVVR